MADKRPDDEEEEQAPPSLGEGSRRWMEDLVGDLPRTPSGGPPDLPWPPPPPSQPSEVESEPESAESAASAAVIETVRVPLALPPQLLDWEGARLVAIELMDLPADAIVSAGEATRPGLWHLEPDQVEHLFVDLPAEGNDPVHITVKVTAEDTTDDSRLTNIVGLDVSRQDALILEPAAEPEPAPAKEIEPEPDIEPLESTIDTEPEEGPEEGTDEEPVAARPPREAPEAVEVEDEDEPVMAVADLQVSVGIDDPEALALIAITIDGVPEGGSLTAGDETAPGVWRMSGLEVANLGVAVPPNCDDFVLGITMRTPSGREESGEIGVASPARLAAEAGAPAEEERFSVAGPAEQANENDDEAPPALTVTVPNADAPDVIIVRLGADPYQAEAALSVHIDGEQVAAGIPDWAAGAWEGAIAWVDIALPWDLVARPPGELVIRHPGTGGGEAPSGPVLAGIDLDRLVIAGDGPFVTHIDDPISWLDRDGSSHQSWLGELIVDISAARQAVLDDTDRAASEAPLMSFEPEPEPAPEATPLMSFEPEPEPAPEATPLMSFEPEPEPAPEATPLMSFEPEPEPEPEPEATPLMSFEPEPKPEPALVAELVDPADILVMDLEPGDARNPRLLTELVVLRRAVRAHAAGDAVVDKGTLYDRLGIDVGTWRDVEARDHHGRPVDLDLAAPRVAPLGLAAATELGLPLDLGGLFAGLQAGTAEVHLAGMPAGALLNKGRNLGGGNWHLNADDCDGLRAHVPPFTGDGQGVQFEVRGIDDGRLLRNGTANLGRPLAGGDGPWILAPTAVPDGRLPLQADDLDPDGYGAAQLTFSNLPPGSLLSHGTNHGDGVWTLETWSGEDVHVRAPKAARESARFSVVATSFDETNGETAIVTRDLAFSPAGTISLVNEGPAA